MHKILISEDNKDFANLLDEVLSSQGYKTHVVFDGQAAINELGTNTYDLVLTDVIMPHKDGFDVVDTVKEKKNTKVIVMSGGSVLFPPSRTVMTVEDKADACLEKPFKMKELINCIEDLLNH